MCLKNNTFVMYGVMSFRVGEHSSLTKDKQAFVKISYYMNWLNDAIAQLSA